MQIVQQLLWKAAENDVELFFFNQGNLLQPTATERRCNHNKAVYSSLPSKKTCKNSTYWYHNFFIPISGSSAGHGLSSL